MQEERLMKRVKVEDAAWTADDSVISPGGLRSFLCRNEFEVRSPAEILADHGGRPLEFVKSVPFVVNREASVKEFTDHWIAMQEKSPDSGGAPLAATSGAPGTGIRDIWFSFRSLWARM